MIDSFEGEHEFLSNFYDSEVTFEGETYPSVEHAYQAAKTTNILERQIVKAAPNAGKAKALGRRLVLRPDWNEIKIEVMTALVRDKFFSHKDLREALLATGEAELIEGNWWGDTFWGVCKGRGANHLGKILMQVRGELIHGYVEYHPL